MSADGARLDLMQRLTASFPDWAVWKNLDRTLHGEGDIDAIAPTASWPVIEAEFRAWAFAEGFTGVVGCRHVPGVVLLMAVMPERGALSELDLCDTFYWRGCPLTTADRVVPLLVDDARGVRVLRPGAEGAILLFLNCVRRGGLPNDPAIESQRVRELLDSDPDGLMLAARAFGSLGPSALRLAEAVREGRWDRSTALRAEARAALGALRQPGHLAGRVRFRLGADRTCPIVAATKGGGRRGSDLLRWMSTPTEHHSLARV